jgi:hypothetical protein
LPGAHQPISPQRRHRFAHHCAADTHRRRHLLLGREPGAGRQLGAADLASDPLGDLVE